MREPAMTPESIMEFGQHAMYVAMLVAAPLLLTALAVGLLVGVIQAATQINEMTLSFIPKLMAMAVVALIAGPWMLRMLVQFTRQLIEGLPGAIR
jgi:flagellar biosynthetic protein FliQ